LHGINQIRSPQMLTVGQNEGARQFCMHLNLDLTNSLPLAPSQTTSSPVCL
jgi:hypothetical protein